MCCALCSPARAHDEVPLGQPGEWLLNGSIGASARWQTSEQPPGSAVVRLGMDRLSLTIAPIVRTFVVTDFAVGAYLVVDLERYDREDGAEFAANGFGGGAVLAYRIGLGTNVFLLPELSLGAVYYDRTAEVPRGVVRQRPGLDYHVFRLLELQALMAPWISTTALQATLSLPFAVVLAPRFFAGLGPYVSVRHASRTATPRGDDWDIALGLSTVFGTWL